MIIKLRMEVDRFADKQETFSRDPLFLHIFCNSKVKYTVDELLNPIRDLIASPTVCRPNFITDLDGRGKEIKLKKC